MSPQAPLARQHKQNEARTYGSIVVKVAEILGDVEVHQDRLFAVM
jgi:hypothetical protein